MNMRASAALFAGILIVLTSRIAVAADDPKPAPAAPCVAATMPAVVPLGVATAVITAKLSASIGTINDVRIQARSKATVGEVVWDAAKPTQVQFKADLTHVIAGSWTIELVGSEGTCRGNLRVTE